MFNSNCSSINNGLGTIPTCYTQTDTRTENARRQNAPHAVCVICNNE